MILFFSDRVFCDIDVIYDTFIKIILLLEQYITITNL